MKRLIITNPTSSKGTVRETAVLKVKFIPKLVIVKLVNRRELMVSQTYMLGSLLT